MQVVRLFQSKADWDPAQHPREPAGSSEGGQFTEAPGVGGGFEGTESRAKWRKAVARRYAEDKEFKNAVDAITMFTQGEFDVLRAIVAHELTGEWPTHNGPSYAEYYGRAAKEPLRGHVMATYKSFIPGQDVSKGLSITGLEAAKALHAAVSTGPRQPAMYRGMFGHELYDKVSKLTAGSKFEIAGPSSFTADADIAVRFSENRAAGQRSRGLYRGTPSIIVEVEAGARGVDVSPLSPWRQREIVSSGVFEVVSVTTDEYYREGGYKAPRAVVKVRQVKPHAPRI